jgi:hypothetical protein
MKKEKEKKRQQRERKEGEKKRIGKEKNYRNIMTKCNM